MSTQSSHAVSEIALRAEQSLRALADAVQGGVRALEILADELDEALFVVDRDQTIVLFNRRAEELTGFSRDEVVGRHCLKGIRCERCLKSCGVFERKRVRDVPLNLFRKDGTPLPVLKSASALHDDQGDVIGAVEVFRPRVAAEAGDVEQATGVAGSRPEILATLEAMLGSLGRSFLLLDGDFSIRQSSAGIAELLGRDPDELRGLPAATVLGEELFGEGSLFRAALVAGDRREGWRAVAAHPEAGARALSVTGAPLQDGVECGGTSGPSGRYLVMIRPEPAANRPASEVDDVVEFEGMVARSPAMRRVFSLVEQLSDNDASVLITGESGTGKELVARAVHARSSRANRPFVAVNCGALPADLLESELFGHVRGSFTGAVRDKAGRFEVAQDGTVFLDEIGDMPLPLQVKLLRVLQERTFERVGDTRGRPFRARIVAATNQDLVGLVADKRFRQDLFYRLNVVPIALPPLRARREDLDALIQHLLAKIGQRRSRARRLSPAAMRALLSFDWPGNVRQLENALEYATAVCEGQTIHREDLPAEIIDASESRQPPPTQLEAPPAPPREGAPAVVADGAKRDEPVPASDRPTPSPVRAPLGRYPTAADIVDALRQSRHRRGAAARLLGVSRTTLWRRMREEGLTAP